MSNKEVQNSQQPNDTCPLAEAALLLNSKWDLVVVYNLLDGPMRFSELKSKISAGLTNSITSSSLTRILRKLETEEILKRDVSAQPGESVEIFYRLTKKGRALEETVYELKNWGKTFLN